MYKLVNGIWKNENEKMEPLPKNSEDTTCPTNNSKTTEYVYVVLSRSEEDVECVFRDEEDAIDYIIDNFLENYDGGMPEDEDPREFAQEQMAEDCTDLYYVERELQ